MAQNAFTELLADYINGSGLQKKEIVEAVKKDYGPQITITDADLSRYLNAQSLPRIDKLAALIDVLGLTQGEITRLMRAVIRRNKASATRSH